MKNMDEFLMQTVWIQITVLTLKVFLIFFFDSYFWKKSTNGNTTMKNSQHAQSKKINLPFDDAVA